MISNEVIEVIIKRRSVRKYRDEQIAANELDTIIEAGRYAPSGGNNQSSHLIVIQDKAILHELTVMVQNEFAKMELEEGMYTSMKSSITQARTGQYKFFYDAPTLIIVANQKGYPNAMADSACLLENMMLAASSIGVGTCWINQLHWLENNEEIHKKMLSLGLKEGETITGGLALGYSDMQDRTALARKGNEVTYI